MKSKITKKKRKGWLIVESRDKHEYRAVCSQETKEYVGTCDDFPTLKWMAKTKDDALTGIKSLVRDFEKVLRANELHRIAEDRHQELDRRLKKQKRNPEEGAPQPEVKERISTSRPSKAELERRNKATAALEAVRKKCPKRAPMNHLVESINKDLRLRTDSRRQILVMMNGRPAGVLTEFEKNKDYNFSYLIAYSGPPISLTMPVEKGSYHFDRFPLFFDAFLPEGQNLEDFLKRTKFARDDYMSQLLAVGRHSTVSVRDYEKAKEKYLSSPPSAMKGKKEKYPRRDEIHERGKAPRKSMTTEEAMELNKKDRLGRDLRLLGISVFGDSDKFDEWMQTPIPALGNVCPCSLLGTADGIQELINELHRIEYGVFS